jgi:hypothetical protein
VKGDVTLLKESDEHFFLVFDGNLSPTRAENRPVDLKDLL